MLKIKFFLLPLLLFFFIFSISTIVFAKAQDEINSIEQNQISSKIFYENYQRKADKEIKKYLNSSFKIVEAKIVGNKLSSRSKDVTFSKWEYSDYPFYFKKIGEFNFKNGEYIVFRAGKIGFSETKNSFSAIKYDKNNSIIGFTKIKILKNSKSKKKLVGFEYVLNSPIDDNSSWTSAKLANIFLLKKDKNYYTQFAYDNKGEIQYYEIIDKTNNKTYNKIFNNEKFETPELKDLSNFEIPADDSIFKIFTKTTSKAIASSFAMFMWFIKGD